MLEEMISKKYDLLKPFLDEKSKRLFAAAEALSIGTGNISIVSRATGMIKYVLLEEAVKRVLRKILLFYPILRHLLNQQVMEIRNLLYVGLVKVFEIWQENSRI